MSRQGPGEFEQLLLLTLARFEDPAPAKDVYHELVRVTGREVSVAAVHITLTRLEGKGWVEVGTADKVHGVRARKTYALTPQGVDTLVALRKQFDLLWEGFRAGPDAEVRG